MQGNMVFEYAINDVSNRVNQFMEEHKLQVEDIDYFIFHQAQKLILDKIH
jgi:3-oxoacyl-[acyl-carrier-protein] synthase-3